MNDEIKHEILMMYDLAGDKDLIYYEAIQRIIDYIGDLEQELQRKDNIINELKEWLNQEKEATIFDYNFAIEDVLDKIKELENGN